MRGKREEREADRLRIWRISPVEGIALAWVALILSICLNAFQAAPLVPRAFLFALAVNALFVVPLILYGRAHRRRGERTARNVVVLQHVNKEISDELRCLKVGRAGDVHAATAPVVERAVEDEIRP